MFGTLIATVGRFSQRTHARPQGWIPVCAVTFFAFCRQVRWRVWRGCRPSLDFSSGFWAVPDPYDTIPGRNRARRLFFFMRQADAFVTPQEFQNEQNRSKNDTKSKNPSLRRWDAPVSSWNVQGRLKRSSCEFLTLLRSTFVVFSLKIHTLRICGPVPFSSNRVSIELHTSPTVAPSPARLVLVVGRL